MTEKKKEDKNTVEERVAKVLSEALAEDLGEIPEVSISVEELRKLEKANRKKKPKKLVKLISVAAVAVIVCAAVINLALPESIVPVDADKNTEMHMKEGDGEVIIIEGDAEGEGKQIYRETDWNKIKDLKDEFEELASLGYVPREYKFEELVIEYSGNNGYNAKYNFINGNKELEIKQEVFDVSGSNTGFSNGDLQTIDTDNGKAYLLYPKNKKGSLTAVLYKGKSRFIVRGDIPLKEIKSIFNNIKMP